MTTTDTLLSAAMRDVTEFHTVFGLARPAPV